MTLATAATVIMSITDSIDAGNLSERHSLGLWLPVDFPGLQSLRTCWQVALCALSAHTRLLFKKNTADRKPLRSETPLSRLSRMES